MSGSCLYGCHGSIRRRFAFVGLLILLTSKTLFSTSIRGITLSIGAVDSALMLRVVPAESAFSTDLGLLILLTSKTLFSTSIRGITLSIGAVDSALMLRVVPAESAFSTDRGQPSLPWKLQRSAPPTAR